MSAPTTQDKIDLLLNMRSKNLASVKNLSKREIIVLMHLYPNKTRPQVATELFVSVETVKTQLTSAYKKLGVSSQEAAMASIRRLVRKALL